MYSEFVNLPDCLNGVVGLYNTEVCNFYFLSIIGKLSIIWFEIFTCLNHSVIFSQVFIDLLVSINIFLILIIMQPVINKNLYSSLRI